MADEQAAVEEEATVADPATETQTETPAAEEQQEQAIEKPDEKPADTPPEYTDFTLPEGIEADPTLLDGFKQTAREMGLPQDQAQKLVDLYGGVIKSQAEAAEKQKADWEAEVKKDPKHEQILGNAKKALVKFADEDTQKLLTETVIGSHPGLIRFLSKIGELVSEDRFVEGGAGGGNTLGLAERIWGGSSSR